MGSNFKRCPNMPRRTFLKAGSAFLMASSTGLRMVSAFGMKADETPFAQRSSPEWVRDLIIYEIATKGFTSPNGPESGTFKSLQARLPYLQELGITGIWLSGHSLADAHHFYNIWTQYANIEPQKIDPTLGTPAEFKALIAEAHSRGIRLFLDVHVHGILSFSPLIKEHPQWFRGGSWRMTDFDWYGGHPDLDEWWVNLWTKYVTEYGVDGFRLDYRIFRPDLWERIRSNAARAGHEIVLFEEDDAVIPGVTDFTQHDRMLRIPPPGTLNPYLVQDLPGFYDRIYGRKGTYQVEIQYADDGTRTRGDTRGQGTLSVRLDGMTEDKISRRLNDDHADGVPDIQLTIQNVAAKPLEEIFVEDDMGGRWQTRWERNARLLSVEGKPPSLQLHLATLGQGYPCLQLSCHDEGWEGFPEHQNPYVAQGSRALFGYSCLFAPMIPIFFAGEEFDASYRPIPWLSAHLFGGEDQGKGRWLYGTMLDWNELKHPQHAAMFKDVRTMMAVRKQESGVLALLPASREPKLLAVPCQHDIQVPVPYLRWNNQTAILVAANRNTAQASRLELRIPLKEAGLEGHVHYKVTNLWPGAEAKTVSEKVLDEYPLTIQPDKSPRGGLIVLKIEPI
ncbi:MAG: alpha-amylase family glycosyl hydrolase [Terriglobia bacterium]